MVMVIFVRFAQAFPVYRANPVYRLTMFIRLSVNIWVKSAGWSKISAMERVTNLQFSLKVTSNKFYWFLCVFLPLPLYCWFQGQITTIRSYRLHLFIVFVVILTKNQVFMNIICFCLVFFSKVIYRMN